MAKVIWNKKLIMSRPNSSCELMPHEIKCCNKHSVSGHDPASTPRKWAPSKAKEPQAKRSA